MEFRYCPKCGNEIREDKDRCDKCGFDFSQLKEKKAEELPMRYLLKRKDPILAGILSFLLPGLGQIYVGDIGRGILITIIAFIIALLALLSNLLIYLAFHFIQIYDAYKEASEYNNLLFEGIEPW